MRIDAHISRTRTRVRGGKLHRHQAERFEQGRAFAVASGIGLPRTWGFSTTAALAGFSQGLEGPVEEAAAERLKRAFKAGRSSLAQRCDTLIERMLPDAAFVGAIIGHDGLHVMSVGDGRVYVQQLGHPQRLTARGRPSGGILRARPLVCSTPVAPGSLVLAGSSTAFSEDAVARVTSLLSRDRGASPSVLANILTEPAARAGAGAAAIVARIT